MYGRSPLHHGKGLCPSCDLPSRTLWCMLMHPGAPCTASLMCRHPIVHGVACGFPPGTPRAVRGNAASCRLRARRPPPAHRCADACWHLGRRLRDSCRAWGRAGYILLSSHGCQRCVREQLQACTQLGTTTSYSTYSAWKDQQSWLACNPIAKTGHTGDSGHTASVCP